MAWRKNQGEFLQLPPYSPNLNRIEGVWGHLKRTYVYNEFLGDERGLNTEVESALQLLNGTLHVVRSLVSAPTHRKVG